jgi:hypothetical protein
MTNSVSLVFASGAPHARRAASATAGVGRATFALEPDEQAAAEAAERRVSIEVDLGGV